MTEKNMTIQEAAEKALALQNGCNLSGIAHTLSQILSEAIWPAAREQNEGTQWVNRHPIVTLILDKLIDLNGYNPGALMQEDFARAYAACQLLANPPAAPAAPAARRESCANRLACESACACTSGWICRYCLKPEADCLCDDLASAYR